MSYRDSIMSHSGTLETLQSHHAPSRRSRPPDIDTMAAEENRVPLKAEKASKRESRLGLRSLFSRSKTHLVSPETPSSWGSHISLPETNPYVLAQPDAALGDAPSSPRSPRPLSTMFGGQQSPSAHPRPVDAVRTQGLAKPGRGPLSTWHPPPLFKAFPQAVKHMTLPAMSLAPEAILRIHERRASTMRDDTMEALEGETAPIEKAKVKKKNRRTASGPFPKFEWTNKIYVLVTSGYLLQYAAEGPFDRLPDKILHLGKDSAAFASDVIPGRHWVVQVSSAAEPDGTPASDSRSLFSRWNFRATERRNASNFLMVFETAEDMEGWISTLRREIENLGGKKTLTETGKPKAEDDAAPLREKPSQRTLVVRDPNRLSRIATQPSQSPDSFHAPQNIPWQGQARANRSATNVAEGEPGVDHPLDDISTTNSFVSHDGRQLDSLRENSNRLSFISSGQRTVVTSAGSSPNTSPTVDTFPTVENKSSLEETSTTPEPKPRPNAAAILDRRQSMQVLSPFVELQGGPVNLRPQSGSESGAAQDVKAPTPNFSVPNSSNRRYSYVKSLAQEFGMAPQSGPLEVRSLGRRAPPTTLPVARPLSMVADQPSPMEEIHERPVTRHGDETQPTISAEDDVMSLPQIPNCHDMTSRRSSLVPTEEPVIEISRPGSSRRHSDMRQWRKSETATAWARTLTGSTRPSLEQRTRSRSIVTGAEDAARRRASLDTFSEGRSGSIPAKVRSQRRASLQSIMSDRISQYSASGDLPPPMAPESLPLPAPPPTVPLPPIPASASNPHLKPDANGKSLFNRRSMPQLSEGPPPAPPPTCALPPIPPKLQVKA